MKAFLKSIFYLTFGCLALTISALVTIWILAHLFGILAEPDFFQALRKDSEDQGFHILGGIISMIGMAAVGAYWVHKSRLLPWIKNQTIKKEK